MDNKYQLLNTLSGDEITVEAKPTKLNTKKLKNHFFVPKLNIMTILLFPQRLDTQVYHPAY